MRKLTKKSQIGNTLTWFTATVIIFFIMVLFLTVSIMDSERKKVTTGWDDVKLEKFDGSLKSQRILFNLLNSDFIIDTQNLKLKDWLKMDLYNLEESKKAVLRESIKSKILELFNVNGEKNCYVFQAVSGINNSEEILKRVDSRGSGYVSDFITKSSIELGSYYDTSVDLRGARIVSEAHKNLLKKSTSIVLVRDTKLNVFGVEEDYQKVNVKFYMGAC